MLSGSLIDSIVINKKINYFFFSKDGNHTIQFTPDAYLSSGFYWLNVLVNGAAQTTSPILLLR